MIRTQRWSLDTCGCVFDQVYDDADYEGTVKNTIVTSQPCPEHAGLLDVEIVSSAIDQNKRKNLLYRHMTELKSDASFVWSFVGLGLDRVLTVTTTGLTPSQKTDLQTWADATFGLGKVLVS